MSFACTDPTFAQSFDARTMPCGCWMTIGLLPAGGGLTITASHVTGVESPMSSLHDAHPFDTRARILDATRRVLRDRPIEALSIVALADSLTLSRRTIYNHFGSVAELYRASRLDLLHGLVPLLPGLPSMDQPPARAVELFVEQAGRLFADSRYVEFMWSTLRDADRQPWLRTELERLIDRPLVQRLERYVRARHARGEMSRFSVSAAAPLLMGLRDVIVASRFVAPDRMAEDWPVPARVAVELAQAA